MSRQPFPNRNAAKDMYWFAHGGMESSYDKCLIPRTCAANEGEEDAMDSCSPIPKSLHDRRCAPDEQKSFHLNSAGDCASLSGPSSLEMRDDKTRSAEKRIAVEERRKQLWEAEQERNDAVLRKHLERDATIEARRNAQRSNISFAFGSSVPRNVESLQSCDSEKTNRHSNASGSSLREENHDILHLRRSVSPFYLSGYTIEVDASSPQPESSQSNIYSERKSFSPPCWLIGSGALIGGGDDIMSRSMTASVPAPRGRRKNDLMPTVPYDRAAAPKTSPPSSTRKRSVSMTRLDQLAQPRRHYVEATKALSTSSGVSSMQKDSIKSPTRPLSSASEQSGGSGRLGSSVTRRVRSSPRKPRPISIAGTVPDSKPKAERVSPVKKAPVASKKSVVDAKRASPSTSKPSSTKSNEKPKTTEKPKPSPRATSAPKMTKHSSTKQPSQPKTSPKAPASKKSVTNKKKAEIMVSTQSPTEPNKSFESAKPSVSPPISPTPDSAATEAERNNAKRIISEEEAKAALAEKRRLAREQAEKEAELERQRQEEFRKQEEERCRLEEEEQKRMEEEQLHLLAEHKKVEEEKLRKAIEENERKEEEERSKREEEQRLKAEQEKKSQEEAEKQRIELEEKLRKEEEERAERKKRLEKIMSRTRGKSSNTSPSGSVSGSEQLDSSDNQHENLSSGANSLDSNPEEPPSVEAHAERMEPPSDGTSVEVHPTYEVASDNESLKDIVMPRSETASQDNSLVIIPENNGLKPEVNIVDASTNESIKISITEEMEFQQFEAVENSQSEMSDTVRDADVSVVENQNVDEGCGVEESTEKNIEIVEIINDPSQAMPLVEATPVTSAEDATAAITNEADIMENEYNPAAMTPTLLPDVSPPSERIDHEEAEIGHHSHFSTSSDIKLPDPIYETSDDGSVSSERHQQEGGNFGLQDEDNHQELQAVTDEVFNERENICSETNFNPFEKQSSQSRLMTAYESQFEIGGMHDSIYDYETPDVLNANENSGDVKENIDDSENENKENMVNGISLNQTDLLADFDQRLDSSADKENIGFNFSESENYDNTDMHKSDIFPEQFNLEIHEIQSSDSSNNPFIVLDQTFEKPPLLNNSSPNPTESLDLKNVTIIKAEGSNGIGIISSLDNDHLSNDLVQQNMQSEQLKSNFQCSSDTEESSLDSNLSQVMTVEDSEKDFVGLNVESDSAFIVNNGQAENPFNEHAVNGCTDLKSNGGHFPEKVLSNGHRNESSDPNLEEINDYVHLDSRHISSVDHSKSNIFDNVDAVDFGNMSPDPFLAKGNSNQISGNPFLLQDDQKPVLMTPDFFN